MKLIISSDLVSTNLAQSWFCLKWIILHALQFSKTCYETKNVRKWRNFISQRTIYKLLSLKSLKRVSLKLQKCRIQWNHWLIKKENCQFVSKCRSMRWYIMAMMTQFLKHTFLYLMLCLPGWWLHTYVYKIIAHIILSSWLNEFYFFARFYFIFFVGFFKEKKVIVSILAIFVEGQSAKL